MLIYGKTDIGMIRNENQDSYEIRDALPSGHAAAVVCDGMGGPAGGRLASGIAVKTYMDCLERRLQSGMDAQEAARICTGAVLEANKAVWTEARRIGYASMGTTLVAATVCASGVAVANVGDSRAYCLYENRIFRVTRDHSLVQDMLERGEITEEEARIHPKRNLITRALGPDERVLCDMYVCQLPPHSLLLLCTDGLTNTLTDGEILDITQKYALERCPEELVEAAKRRGAPDNVTVVIMRNAEGGEAP